MMPLKIRRAPLRDVYASRFSEARRRLKALILRAAMGRDIYFSLLPFLSSMRRAYDYAARPISVSRHQLLMSRLPV